MKDNVNKATNLLDHHLTFISKKTFIDSTCSILMCPLYVISIQHGQAANVIKRFESFTLKYIHGFNFTLLPSIYILNSLIYEIYMRDFVIDILNSYDVDEASHFVVNVIHVLIWLLQTLCILQQVHTNYINHARWHQSMFVLVYEQTGVPGGNPPTRLGTTWLSYMRRRVSNQSYHFASRTV